MAYRAYWMSPGMALAKDRKETYRAVKQKALAREMGKSWVPWTPSKADVHRSAHERRRNYSEIQTRTSY